MEKKYLCTVESGPFGKLKQEQTAASAESAARGLVQFHSERMANKLAPNTKVKVFVQDVETVGKENAVVQTFEVTLSYHYSSVEI